MYEGVASTGDRREALFAGPRVIEGNIEGGYDSSDTFPHGWHAAQALITKWPPFSRTTRCNSFVIGRLQVSQRPSASRKKYTCKVCHNAIPHPNKSGLLERPLTEWAQPTLVPTFGR
jgi:hypothetical protein